MVSPLQIINVRLVAVQIVFQKLDGRRQTLLEGVLGLPVGHGADLGGIAQQAVDLALLGAQTLLVAHDLRLGVDLADQLIGQIADGMLLAGGDVHLLADGGVAASQCHEARRGVLHIVEVAGGGQAAQLDLGGASEQLGDDGGNHSPGALARAVGVEGPHDGDRQIKAAVEALGQTVRTDLGGGIGALALIGMLLVDGHILGGAVHLAGAGDQQALGAHLTGCVQHVQGALDVGVHIAVRAVVAEGDGDQRRQMVNDVLPFHGMAHAVGVADIAHEHLNLVFDLPGQGVQPAPGAEGIVVAEGLDLLALSHQLFGEVAANEAVGSGDHHSVRHIAKISFTTSFVFILKICRPAARCIAGRGHFGCYPVVTKYNINHR